MKNCIKHLGFCKLQVCWCRAGGLKGMKSCIKYLGFCKLQVCWCRAGGLKGVKNQSKPSVLQDSDPLVGCVYGIYLSAVCVCGCLKGVKNQSKPSVLQVWVLGVKTIKAPCCARFGSTGWLCVCHLPVGCVCGWLKGFGV